MEIAKMMVVAATHVTEKEYEWLGKVSRGEVKDEPFVEVVAHAYGFFVSAVDPAVEEDSWWLGENLRLLIKLAIENDCTWINLDVDGFPTEELIEYDW